MNITQATLIMNKKNTIKTIYNSEIERIQPILKKFLNTKITTIQGTKTKAFEKALKDDEFKHNLNLFSDFIAIKINRIYYKILYGSLALDIRVSFTDLKEENNFKRTTYEEQTFYIGETKNQILRKILNIEKPEIINIKEQLKYLEEYQKIEQKYNQAKDKLNYCLRVYLFF